MVECRPHNPKVVGSKPTGITVFKIIFYVQISIKVVFSIFMSISLESNGRSGVAAKNSDKATK